MPKLEYAEQVERARNALLDYLGQPYWTTFAEHSQGKDYKANALANWANGRMLPEARDSLDIDQQAELDERMAANSTNPQYVVSHLQRAWKPREVGGQLPSAPKANDRISTICAVGAFAENVSTANHPLFLREPDDYPNLSTLATVASVARNVSRKNNPLYSPLSAAAADHHPVPAEAQPAPNASTNAATSSLPIPNASNASTSAATSSLPIPNHQKASKLTRS